MAIQLTPHILRQAYELLSACEPFVRWNLPDADEIKFRVAKDKNCAGWHHTKRGRPPHTIAISNRLIGSLYTLLEVMAHELIHLHMVHSKIPDTSDHGKAFQKFADQVCKAHHVFDRTIF